MENYYEILEVKNDASDEVIKAAYRALIKKYHPDNGGGQDPTGDKMCLVNEAYECLSDPVRRKQYDQKIQSTSFEPREAESYKPQKHTNESEVVKSSKDKSLFSQIVSGVVAGVQGAMDNRQAEMENAYLDSEFMPDYSLIDEYRNAVGAKRNGYAKALMERGYLVRDNNGRFRPTEKYKKMY